MCKSIAAGDTKKVALLLKAGVPADGEDTGGTKFIVLAAMLGQADVFMLLADEGADLSTPDLLSWSVDGNGGREPVSREIVSYLLENGPELSSNEIDEALRFACVSGDSQIVATLLQRGGDPNGYDPELLAFPLLNATRESHEEIVSMLLDAGADPSLFMVKDLDDQGNETTVSTLVEFANTASTQNIKLMLEQKAS